MKRTTQRFSVATTLLGMLVILVPQTASAQYEPELREAFLAACQEQASDAHCGCVLAKLEATVDEDAFISEAGPPLDAINAAVDSCLREVNVVAGSWPTSAKSDFVQACTDKGDTTPEQCACITQALSERLSLETVLNEAIPEAELKAIQEKCRLGAP